MTHWIVRKCNRNVVLHARYISNTNFARLLYYALNEYEYICINRAKYLLREVASLRHAYELLITDC